jgi:hypothetical protein
MTTRRGFLAGLSGILAAGFAPAAIGSGVLMPVRKIVAPGHPLFHGNLTLWNGLELSYRDCIVPSSYWRDVSYYDGMVWTPEEIAALDAMPRREPLVFNRIRPAIHREAGLMLRRGDKAGAEAMVRLLEP